jgi:hypothetical protein
MLLDPKCYTRKCKHFIGVKQDKDKDGEYDEATERNVCKAFPDGIPSEIAYGNDPHTKVFPGQDNKIIYSK